MKDTPIELVTISGFDLEQARPKLLGGDATAFEALRHKEPDAEPYPHSSHYLAFVVSHLMDEGVLPDSEWDLEQALYELRGKRLTSVIARKGANLSNLEPKRFDPLELRREFHGGGELGKDAEETALLDAICVLQSNLQSVDEGGALVLLFKPDKT